MLTPTATVDWARPRVEGLVERERLTTRSLMRAYENVAELLGASPSWVRKILGRQPDVDVKGHIALNLLQATDASDPETARDELQALRARLDRIERLLAQGDAGAPGALDSAPGRTPGRQARAPRALDRAVARQASAG